MRYDTVLSDLLLVASACSPSPFPRYRTTRHITRRANKIETEKVVLEVSCKIYLIDFLPLSNLCIGPLAFLLDRLESLIFFIPEFVQRAAYARMVVPA